jgi:microcompartment protein CcmL/EutN
MPQAVGVIQTVGFPPVLAAADAMVKAGAVTLVYYGLAERVEAGVRAVEETPGDNLVSHYIVPNPPENVESVLPIHFTDEVEDFRFNL